jgi:carboxymethylenebutenolidase
LAQLDIRATDSGSFSAYLALPKAGKGPVVVVIQEIFGVNPGIRALCDGYAAQGYVAAAPDLFWRINPGIELNDRIEIEKKRAFGLFGKFDVEAGVGDLRATIAALRKHPACAGKLGTVGYCLGGKLAYLMATRSDSDCNVGYYGVGIQDLLGEAKAIKHPLMLHIAGKDEFVPKPAQDKIHAGLGSNPLVTLHDYPNCDHAFAREGGDHYDAAAAKSANQRTAEFFRRHLGG